MKREAKKQIQSISSSIAKKYRSKEIELEACEVTVDGKTINALKAVKDTLSVSLVLIKGGKTETVDGAEVVSDFHTIIVNTNGEVIAYGSKEDPLPKGACKAVDKIYALKAKRDSKINGDASSVKEIEVLAQVAKIFSSDAAPVAPAPAPEAPVVPEVPAPETPAPAA